MLFQQNIFVPQTQKISSLHKNTPVQEGFNNALYTVVKNQLFPHPNVVSSFCYEMNTTSL